MVWRGSACADGDCARRCGQNRMHTLRTAQAIHSAYVPRSTAALARAARVGLGCDQPASGAEWAIRFGPFGRMTVAVSRLLSSLSGLRYRRMRSTVSRSPSE